MPMRAITACEARFVRAVKAMISGNPSVEKPCSRAALAASVA
jgi:hypothetical protein